MVARGPFGLCAALCVGLALGCPPPQPAPDGGTSGWRLVLDELPGTLLSAWEADDGVLYAVGGNASRSLVLRHDADGWWEMESGTSSVLWWVHGFSSRDVYAVGANGVVTHFNGTGWRVEREGADFTLFGVWGATPEELIAVGGVVTTSRPRAAVVTRRSGWAEVSTAGLPPGRALFKVWGATPGDFFVVGERGLLARGIPGAFVSITAPTLERLTTVHGAAAEVYAVGGLIEPVLLRLAGANWRSLPIPGTPQLLNGVAVNKQGELVVVGLNGYLAEGRGETLVERAPLTRRGLHGSTATGDGFVAVGGELLGAFGHGVLLARGKLEPGELRRWPSPGIGFDAGTGGGRDGGSVRLPDGGWLGPGASCDREPLSCAPGTDCWLVYGPFTSFCGAICSGVHDCGAYGAGACCQVPGPQVTLPVCLPRDAGVCDGG